MPPKANLPPYIPRLHDEMLVGLYRAMRKGNFLLVGNGGEGKTASLTRFSDLLIDSGTEFSLLPSPHGNRNFLPPLAKINLIDDVQFHNSEPLTRALIASRSTSLNIMTTRPQAVERIRSAIPLDEIIEIKGLSLSEKSQFFSEWQKANHVDKGIAGSLRALQEFTGDGKRTPKELNFLIESLRRSSITSFKSEWTEEKIAIIKPRIITLNKQLTTQIRKSPSQLDSLTPDQFEEFVGELFEEQGYSVTLTRKSGDGGVDVIAEKRDIIDFSVLVQCKKYAPHRPIGAHVIREMTGVLDINRATAGAIFTTSRFTGAAMKEAKAIRHKLSLFDYFDLLTCLNRTGRFNAL